MADQTVELLLGSFFLHGGIDEDWTVDLLAEDFSPGAPAPVDVTVQTLLQNSSSVMTDRYDNREVTFKVRLTAPDGIMLAEAEAALFAELGKPNLMTWTPPQAFAPPTVFRVITSSMAPEFDDLSELRCRRVYSLTLTCEAFNRSVDEVVTEAEVQQTSGGVPVAAIDTLVDDCSTGTAWSNPNAGGSVVAAGGTVHTEPAVDLPKLRRTGTIDMTSTPLLVVDAKVPAGAILQARFDTGSAASAIGMTASAVAGYKRYFFRAPGTTTSYVEFSSRLASGTSRIYVAEVRKQNNPPVSGTLRQKTFTVAVAGSAPSDGTLEVYRDLDSLGVVMAYTWAESDGQGFNPALRPLLATSGVTTADSALVSGARNVVSSAAIRYDIPADDVTPGTYEVWAWLRSSLSGAQVLGIAASTRIGSTPFDFYQADVPLNFAAANTWELHSLGRVQLPVNRTPLGSSAVTRFEVGFVAGTTATIDLDETYLFGLDHGALTVVDADTARRVWITPATLDWPTPSVLCGDTADMSDAVSRGSMVMAWGNHQARPPGMNAFIVTRDALDAGVRFTHIPAWHTNAAL